MVLAPRGPLGRTGSKQTAKMSARDENTFAEEGAEMEELDEAGSDDDEGVEMEEDRADGEAEKKVYVPGMEPLQPGEELEMDRTAYRMYHECQTGKLETVVTSPSLYMAIIVLFAKNKGFASPPTFRIRKKVKRRCCVRC